MTGHWSAGVCPEYALVALWIDGRLDFGCLTDDPGRWRWASETA